LLPPGPEGEVRRAARALLRTARALQRQPGIRGWQAFRTMGGSDSLLALVEWSGRGPQPPSAQADGVLAALGFELLPVRILPRTYDRMVSNRAPVSSLLRLARPAAGSPVTCPADVLRLAEEEQAFALQALGAPGSLRVRGGSGPTGTMCRVDFESDDAVWPFLEGAVNRRWAARTGGYGYEVTWAIDLPRLRGDTGADANLARPPQREPLSVRFEYVDGHARLHLQGSADDHGIRRCHQLCTFLMAERCRHLEVDISDLRRGSPEVLAVLVSTARALRRDGAEFTLVDNAARASRVTRRRHLHGSLG
jgi:anti-anti-sigma regulatory factor